MCTFVGLALECECPWRSKVPDSSEASYGWILGLALVLCKNSILSYLSSPLINVFMFL